MYSVCSIKADVFAYTSLVRWQRLVSTADDSEQEGKMSQLNWADADRLTELAATLQRGLRGPSHKEQTVSNSDFLDRLNAAIDAGGSNGMSAEQRALLYEVLLAANACDVAALSRLLVVANRDERNLLAGYRGLNNNGRAGVRQAVERMAAQDGRPSRHGSPPRSSKVFNGRVHQVADQIYVINGRDKPDR
jgi:hypothetical protein